MMNRYLRFNLPKNLPKELIEEVLSWLPVKDLMRLRCVCKFWNNLILSDVAFIKLHLRRSALRNPHLLLQCNHPLTQGGSRVVPFPVSGLIGNPLITLSNNPSCLPPLKHDELICYHSVVGSCNGLICLHGRSDDDSASHAENWLCFWNPATRLITEKLGSFHAKNPSFKFSFGYDNSTHTFKVLLFYFKTRAPMRIFTLGCNLWRVVQNLPAGVFPYRDQKPNDGVNLRGTLNWLASQNNDNDYKAIPAEQYVIFSFDMGTETSTQFSLPSGCDEKPFVGALMDCLCLSYVWKETHYVIWQMKEFGVEKSWSQLLKIQFQDSGFRHPLFPLGFYNGDTLILGSTFDTHEAILHYTRKNRTQRIKMTDVLTDVLWSAAMGYVESLVSPYGK